MPSTFIESIFFIESIDSNESDSLQKNEQLSITHSKPPFNFQIGEAKCCLKTLVCESDLNSACEKIKRKRGIGQSLKEKYKKFRKKTSTKIIHHTGRHVFGKDCSEDTLRRFQISEYAMCAKQITSNEIYI